MKAFIEASGRDVDGLAGLPAFRVLMVWVYDRTESLFVGMLMHFSITACTLILTPQATGVPLLAYGLAFAGAVRIVIAAVAVGHRRPQSRVEMRGHHQRHARGTIVARAGHEVIFDNSRRGEN